MADAPLNEIPGQAQTCGYPTTRSGSLVATVAMAAAACVAILTGSSLAGPPPGPAPEPRTSREDAKPAIDLNGDPLPPHAIVRLGTLRFRTDRWISQLMVVPGGKQILVVGSTAVLLWDAATGREVRRFEVPHRIKAENGETYPVQTNSFALSPDGKTLAVSACSSMGKSPTQIILFDFATGRRLGELLPTLENSFTTWHSFAFVTPNLLATAGMDDAVVVWDVTTRREVRRLLLPAGGRVTAVVPSPERKHLFVSGWDGQGDFFWLAWELPSGTCVRRTMGLGRGLGELAISPDGGTLAVSLGRDLAAGKYAGYTELRLVSVTTWEEQRRWRSHDGNGIGYGCAVAFSPDGKMLASGGADGSVRQWDVASGREIRRPIEFYRHSQQISFLDTNSILTYGAQNAVKIWDAATGKPKHDLPGLAGHVTALACSPDGRFVAIGGGDSVLCVWEMNTGKQVACLRVRGVAELRFSADGKRIVLCDNEDVIREWEWESSPSAQKRIVLPTKPPCLTLSPDGYWFASWDQSGFVSLWDLTTGKRCRELNGRADRISCLAFSRDGRSVFGSFVDDTLPIRHWDVQTGRELGSITTEPAAGTETVGHTSWVGSVALSPGNRWLYSGSSDQSICVWDVATGRPARQLKKEAQSSGIATTIVLSPDGTRLAAVRCENERFVDIDLWDISTGQMIRTLKGHGGGRSMPRLFSRRSPVGLGKHGYDGSGLGSHGIGSTRRQARRESLGRALAGHESHRSGHCVCRCLHGRDRPGRSRRPVEGLLPTGGRGRCGSRCEANRAAGRRPVHPPRGGEPGSRGPRSGGGSSCRGGVEEILIGRGENAAGRRPAGVCRGAPPTRVRARTVGDDRHTRGKKPARGLGGRRERHHANTRGPRDAHQARQATVTVRGERPVSPSPARRVFVTVRPSRNPLQVYVMPKAIRIHTTGGPEVLKWEDVEVGEPGPGQARVRHTAVGVNFIDTYYVTSQ
ncbi:Quinone oxidoreductase [Fimbriiglobus ruber]|uniref:Quinone oxidoreductase n=2 Tax=Fimbriiglobus ruber TaxID=1908690 RepID=A0A225CYM0_9BACT|nr:Quinone oxidoreductase [Fimbriiglobus ruber]